MPSGLRCGAQERGAFEAAAVADGKRQGPTPAEVHYVASPRKMAKTLLRPVLEILDGGVITHRAVRIMPSFIREETLVAPRAGEAAAGAITGPA